MSTIRQGTGTLAKPLLMGAPWALTISWSIRMAPWRFILRKRADFLAPFKRRHTMADPEPKIRCPRCGNQEARTGVYCGNCGAPLHSVVNVVNDSTIPSEYEAPNAPPVASSEQRPFTGYGGPVSHTPIPLSPTQPRSGQNQPTELSDQVIQYQYASTPPSPPPPPPPSNPPPPPIPT